MIKNAIELPGAKNARELGGFAVDGGRIKKGVLHGKELFFTAPFSLHTTLPYRLHHHYKESNQSFQALQVD